MHECDLVRIAVGRSCRSLQDLLDAILEIDDEALVHHTMRTALADHFEPPAFPNDFATWCWTGLREHGLSERLGLIDPYQTDSPAELRRQLAVPIEAELRHLERVPSCDPGAELHLESSRLVVHRLEALATPEALAGRMARLPLRAVFLHVHEAVRERRGGPDDFSVWLERRGAPADLLRALRRIDFHFLQLAQLRATLSDLLLLHCGAEQPA